MNRWAIQLWLCLLAAGSAQAIELPRDGFAEGWQRDEPVRRFVGNDLYGHINGGAELFHEFGFDQLLVQRYQEGEAELDLEVYLMECPNAALGIYLMKVHDETPIEGLEVRNSANVSQITALKGPCFLQVNNFDFDSSLLPVMVTLVRQTLAAVPDDSSKSLLDLLPVEGLVPGSEKLIRGPYAMETVYTLGEGDILQLGGKVFGVVGRYEQESGGEYTRIFVEYPTDAQAAAAFENVVANRDAHLTVLERSERRMVFRDYQGEYGLVVGMYGTFSPDRGKSSGHITIMVHLAEDPRKSQPWH